MLNAEDGTFKKNTEQSKPKRKNLTYEDMKLIGWKLSFHFRLKKVPRADLLESLVVGHDPQARYITYERLKKTLSEMPFSINDKEELEKLSRYLIEDEDEDEEAKESSKQGIAIVKSIFNRLLGSYEGKSEREFNLINDGILAMLDKRKVTVESALDDLKEPVKMIEVERFFSKYVTVGNLTF